MSYAAILAREDIIVYQPVSRTEIADALVHIRDLYRQTKPSNALELLASERREVGIKDFLSNLPRTKEHPTLKAIDDIASMTKLTTEGAHSLFGYNVGKIRTYDLQFNSGRTHIIESYLFERERLIDLPLQFASEEVSRFNGILKDMVIEWQTGIPMRVLEEAGWLRPDTLFVHVGTEDSLGSSLPPGSLALVDPITQDEKYHPNPRVIYLLQFGNGYCCCRCVVSRGKLQLLISERAYLGPQAFDYPGEVRIVGRVRMFALKLPLPEYPQRYALPVCRRCAELIMPAEQQNRNLFFATEHKRFRRTKSEEEQIRETFQAILGSTPSKRTERRYREFTSSEPRVASLIYFSLANFARYSDALRIGGSLISDAGRFSLETLLNARWWTDLLASTANVREPQPAKKWELYRRELIEWLPLLSVKYPELRFLSDRVLRLTDDSAIQGLEPPIGSGSWMLLERDSVAPNLFQSERKRIGWSRPIYVLRRGSKNICGYVERDGDRFALLSSAKGYGIRVAFGKDELQNLWRAGCVLISV